MAMIQGSLTYLRRVLVVLVHMLLRWRRAAEGPVNAAAGGDVLADDAGSLETSIWYFLFYGGYPQLSDARSWLAVRLHDAEKIDAGHVVDSSSLVGWRRTTWTLVAETKVAECGRLDGKLSDFRRCTIRGAKNERA